MRAPPGSRTRRDVPPDTCTSHDSQPRTRPQTPPGPATDRVRRLYDRAAPSYARYRHGWLALAGDTAEKAMLADLAGALRPGQRVLDAGSGTGAASRHIRRLCPGVELTMVDLSAGMLEEAGDVDAPRVNGSLVGLPFPDDTFDVVASAWVIETVPDPRQAVTELLRVLAPGGRLVYTFCSRPTGWWARAWSLALRGIVRWGFAGRFLDAKRTPWHDCVASHRYRFHRGLTTEIALAKCCTVADADLPAAVPGDSLLDRVDAPVTLVAGLADRAPDR